MSDDGPGRQGHNDPGGRSSDPGNVLCSRFLSLPIDGASISVVGAGSLHTTLAASNSLAAQLDELQFDLSEGPHWQAVHEDRVVLAPDLTASRDNAWPMFSSAALRAGVHAVFAFPLRLGAVVIGVVDLYRTAPGPLDDATVQTAELLAAGVTASAARLALRSARDETQEGLTGAASMRREVHQAVGMIIVQLDVSATDAFARLRAHAFVTGRSVHDVAFDVVGKHIDFGSLPDDRIGT